MRTDGAAEVVRRVVLDQAGTARLLFKRPAQWQFGDLSNRGQNHSPVPHRGPNELESTAAQIVEDVLKSLFS